MTIKHNNYLINNIKNNLTYLNHVMNNKTKIKKIFTLHKSNMKLPILN